MDFVHHSRMVFFAQVNDVHAARSCSNSGALRDWAAGQTFGLKQPKITAFKMYFFPCRYAAFCVYSWWFPRCLQNVYFWSCIVLLVRHSESNLSFHIHDTEEIPMWRPQLQFSTPFQRLQPRRNQHFNNLWVKKRKRKKHTITMHWYSWAKQTFYQTNILVSTQHRWCHEVAAGNPREPEQFIWLVRLQQEEVSLGIKKLVFIQWLLYVK